MSVGTWESHHDILTLLYLYTEYIDAADFDAIGELFAHGKITTRGMEGATEGREAVRDLYKNTNKVHSDGTLRTRMAPAAVPPGRPLASSPRRYAAWNSGSTDEPCRFAP